MTGIEVNPWQTTVTIEADACLKRRRSDFVKSARRFRSGRVYFNETLRS